MFALKFNTRWTWICAGYLPSNASGTILRVGKLTEIQTPSMDFEEKFQRKMRVGDDSFFPTLLFF